MHGQTKIAHCLKSCKIKAEIVVVLKCSEPPQGRVAEIVEKIAKSASFLQRKMKTVRPYKVSQIWKSVTPYKSVFNLSIISHDWTDALECTAGELCGADLFRFNLDESFFVLPKNLQL